MSTRRAMRDRVLVPRRARRGRAPSLSIGLNQLIVSAPPPGEFQSGVPTGGGSVRLQTADGRDLHIAGVSITARTPLGSAATLTTVPAVAVTNADGVATFTEMMLLGTAGVYGIEFRASDIEVEEPPPEEPEEPPPGAVDTLVRLEIRKAGTLIATRELEPAVLGPGESPRYEIVLTAEEKTALGAGTGVQAWIVAYGGTRAVRARRLRGYV